MNTYQKLENRMNQVGVRFTRSTTGMIDLFDGQVKLGKKYKPQLQKFVSHIVKVAEANKVRESYKFTLFSFAYPSLDNLALEVVLYDDSKYNKLFSFRAEQYGVKDKEKVMKHFLRSFSQWLKQEK